MEQTIQAIMQPTVGFILLVVVVGSLLYIFFSRTNAVEKTGYGSLIMLALVSLMIPVFWILNGHNQAEAEKTQHELALERGMQTYALNCTFKCYGIRDDKVINAMYNGYTISDLNEKSDDELRRIISAGVWNEDNKDRPVNLTALPKSDQYGGGLLSNDVDYLFQFIRSADPKYLKTKGLPAGNGFDKLPAFLQNTYPQIYATGQRRGIDFSVVADMTNAREITITIKESDPTKIQGCIGDVGCFDPANIRVKVGTKITWVNEDSNTHTIVAAQGTDPGVLQPISLFDSSTVEALKDGMKKGDKFTYTVTTDAYNLNKDHTVLYYSKEHLNTLAKLTIVQ
jgi:plastocyanin